MKGSILKRVLDQRGKQLLLFSHIQVVAGLYLKQLAALVKLIPESRQLRAKRGLKSLPVRETTKEPAIPSFEPVQSRRAAY